MKYEASRRRQQPESASISASWAGLERDNVDHVCDISVECMEEMAQLYVERMEA
jgi:hypothetical protein